MNRMENKFKEPTQSAKSLEIAEILNFDDSGNQNTFLHYGEITDQVLRLQLLSSLKLEQPDTIS